jgi:hypothetical protein
MSVNILHIVDTGVLRRCNAGRRNRGLCGAFDADGAGESHLVISATSLQHTPLYPTEVLCGECALLQIAADLAALA